MDDLQILIDKADQELEMNDFGRAIIDYRSAALISPPSQTILDNLRISEQEEALQFRRELSIKHPNSYLVQMSLADSYARFHYKRQAIDIYTKILNTIELDIHEQTRIRLKRLRAICMEGYSYPTLFLEDFWVIWRFGDEYGPAKKLRVIMLRFITYEAEDEYAIKSLKLLIASDELPSLVKNLLEVKINEIHMLNQVQY